MSLPSTIRTHQIARYWYCAEQSRLMILEKLEAPESERMNEGLLIHQWLETRPKSRKEMELFESLKTVKLQRKFENIDVVAHPDDLDVLGRNAVQIIEYKTTDNTSIKPWKSSIAEYQLKIYCWVLEPLLKQLGYYLTHYHSLIFLSKHGVFLRKITVEKDNYCTERMLKEIFGFWKTGEPLIAPMKWKCKDCPRIFRDKCRVVR